MVSWCVILFVIETDLMRSSFVYILFIFCTVLRYDSYYNVSDYLKNVWRSEDLVVIVYCPEPPHIPSLSFKSKLAYYYYSRRHLTA